jgi:DNA-directed RNA polymerase subunit L
MQVSISTEKEYVDSKTLTEILPEIKEILPTLPIERATIKLKKTFPEFANMLRRTLIGELPTKILVCYPDESNNHQTMADHRIFLNMVQSKLSQLPLRQDKNYENITFSLDVTNQTTSNMIIRSSSLVASNGKKTTEYFDGSAHLCTLHPGKRLKIDEIVVESRYAKGKKYGCKMIGGNPKQSGDETNISLTVENLRRTPIKYILDLMCSELYMRLEKFDEIISEFKIDSDGSPAISFNTDIRFYDGSYVFIGETTTILTALQQYILTSDSAVQAKVYATSHPEIRSTNLKIVSPSQQKLMLYAIRACRADLDKVHNAVKLLH